MSFWQEFGSVIVATDYPKRLVQMRLMHGANDARKCGDCAHLRRVGKASVHLKCSLARQTSGAATDWRARWPACGRFSEAAK